jgi:hypothetical protein
MPPAAEPLAFTPPNPNAPAGHLAGDLDALVAELGASYPVLSYAVPPDEELDATTALDAVIFAGLVHP